ncbi:MAG: 4-hydroxythreonine-4-phosphate dehydrogenase PdxA [Gammaproteobacteria bacterium]|nr:4-hydroxythreonine-4-phosphate dehydrogenase PdxA [Gammaproteobacteria bacterium]
MPPRIVLTSGEPAGIGPELVIMLAARQPAAEVVVVADPDLLSARAAALGLPLLIEPYRQEAAAAPARPGRLLVEPVLLAARSLPGRPDPANAGYVLETLKRACHGCQSGEFVAMVTAPVHKGVINEAGIPFSGHTEFLAEMTGASQPVMLLVAGELRIALLTTHIALREVPAQVSRSRILSVTRTLDAGLRRLFGIQAPRIAVLGLNPHAGESGHLGSEERDIIGPALEELRGAGLTVSGPLPADSAFTRESLARCDAVLAMYHDQGLPVLKHVGFGAAVNVTLGLPIIRTSVDHGTAFDLAGTGKADPGSLAAATSLALELAQRPAG